MTKLLLTATLVFLGGTAAWAQSGMQILVSVPNHAIITVDVGSADSIEDVKAKIQDKLGVSLKQQGALFYKSPLVRRQHASRAQHKRRTNV